MPKIDLTKIKTYSIKSRPSKVNKADFAAIGRKGAKFASFFDGLPSILAVKEFKLVVDKIITARKNKKPVIFMFGAHVIKCGLSPLIIDLIEKNIITAVALNGAGVIHDTEIAMAGYTSEDVSSALSDGSFGMVKETAEFINNAIKSAVENEAVLAKAIGFSQRNTERPKTYPHHEGRGFWPRMYEIGIGRAVGQAINKAALKNSSLSILAVCAKKKISATVHVAIGADIIHQHPSCDGASLGAASLSDFHIFIEQVASIGSGGVVVNAGSAVILPEVFVKALNVARNLGFNVKDFTTVNFDMIQHYRPNQNVVCRPVQTGGRGISITGHHEIMLPLLHQAIIEKM